jgi:hypothetical protein
MLKGRGTPGYAHAQAGRMRMSAGMVRENMPATSVTRRHVLRQGLGRCPITPDPRFRRTTTDSTERCDQVHPQPRPNGDRRTEPPPDQYRRRRHRPALRTHRAGDRTRHAVAARQDGQLAPFESIFTSGSHGTVRNTLPLHSSSHPPHRDRTDRIRAVTHDEKARSPSDGDVWRGSCRSGWEAREGGGGG